MGLKKTVQIKETTALNDSVGGYTIDMLNTLIAQSRSAGQPMLTYLLSMALIEAHRVSAEPTAPTHEMGMSLN